MSYASIAQCAADKAFLDRVTACIATEEYTMSPEPLAASIIWQVAGHKDIEDAYAYALLQDKPDPGGDPAIITDQMILSAVQPLIPISGPPPPTA